MIGLSAGVVVAGGVFAFITMLGLVTRLASRTNTAKHILLYEDSVTLGGTLGNILLIFSIRIPIGEIGLIVFGIFSGVFVGCLAIALAEIINTMPIFSKRIGLKRGMPFIVLCLAIGKAVGSFIQLYLLR